MASVPPACWGAQGSRSRSDRPAAGHAGGGLLLQSRRGEARSAASASRGRGNELNVVVYGLKGHRVVSPAKVTGMDRSHGACPVPSINTRSPGQCGPVHWRIILYTKKWQV